jgi:hypothetical protein
VDVHEPVTDVPVSHYFRYQYANEDYRMFTDRMEKGWTAEFILTFAPDPETGENVLFYMGKAFNEATSGHTIDFMDNNFTVAIKDKRVVLEYSKYINECDCDTPEVKIRQFMKVTTQLNTTGSTNNHLVMVFERDLGLEGEDLLYKGGNIDCENFPNTRWFDGKKYRMGRIKVYFNGLLKDVIEGVEETIFRETENPLPQIQGWGLSDESTYELSVAQGITGSYTGDILRGRYYEVPLTADLIKINFEIFAKEYNITNPISNC